MPAELKPGTIKFTIKGKNLCQAPTRVVMRKGGAEVEIKIDVDGSDDTAKASYDPISGGLAFLKDPGVWTLEWINPGDTTSATKDITVTKAP